MRSLTDVRDFLTRNRDGGVHCPACDQFAKVYKRQITAAMARAMILMWRNAGRELVFMPDLLDRKQHDEAKLRYWGLVTDEGADGPGWWRLTHRGEAFVKRLVTVPRFAHVYNGACLELSGEQVDIVTALRTKFDYKELMSR